MSAAPALERRWKSKGTPRLAMPPGLRRIAVLLGLLMLIGGFGIDIYLPLMPRMAGDLGVPIGRVQLSLTVFILALALGQIVYGPLSDRFGRRGPMLAGLALFILASVGCAAAGTLGALLVARFLQGIGASAMMVIAQATTRDLATGPTAVRLLSLIVGVSGLAPILSPLIGGSLDSWVSWRWLFVALGAAGLPGILLILRYLPETRIGAGDRVRLGPALRAIGRDRRFLGYAMLPGLTQASTFAFVSSSAFLFIQQLGMRPSRFGLLFGATSLMLVGGAQASGPLVERFGSGRVVTTAIAIHAAAAFALLGATICGQLSFALACACFVAIFGMIGLIGSPVTVLALAPHGRISGTAAALLGATNFALSALGSHLASILNDGTPLPLAIVMTAFTSLALLLAFAVFAIPRRTPGDRS